MILFVLLLSISKLALNIQASTSLPNSYSSSASSKLGVPPATEWNKTYGGLGSQGAVSVAHLADGGYILFGKNGINAWLVRTDISGNMLWNRTYAPLPNTEVEVKSGTVTTDGGFIIAGGLRHVQTGVGDAWLVKTDAFGNIGWNKTYGRDGHEFAFSAQQTVDGGYILAGTAAPLGINNDDFYLVKTNAEGNMEWNKTYGKQSSNEIAWSVQRTTDGGYILAGDTFPFAASWTDGWVVKTDTYGNMIWNLTYGRPEGGDWIYDIHETSDDGYIMAGCYDRRPEARAGVSGDFWLTKIDNNGSIQWSKQYGETDPFSGRYESAHSVRQTSDSGFIAVGQVATGYYESDIWLIRTDFYGNMIWNKIFEGSGSAVIQTNDKGYAVAGATPWISVEDGSDMLLIKIMRANPPVATFTYSPTNASVQQGIVFNASSSYDLDEDIASYRWNFDDGNVSSTLNAIISHTFVSPRIYNVTLTITDNEGLYSSLSKTVWVRVVTYVTISSSAASTFVGFPVEFAGKLYDMYGNGLKNETVSLHSYAGGDTWTQLAADTTDSLGNFSIIWTPTTIGNYKLKAEWVGNQTFFPTSNITNINVIYIPTSISIALSSSTSLIGFKIEINGDLTSDIGAVSNAPILLSYSVTGGQAWNDITLTYTASDGNYSAVWMPSATGNYIVKAKWAGNSTYLGATRTVNLAVAPYEGQNVFSVESNSTISALTLNATSLELSFSVSGETGTRGYVKVTIAKSLISNIADIKVYLDGNQIEYSATSQDDVWILTFTYTHSTRYVTIDLKTAIITGIPPDLTWIYIMTALIVIAILSGIVIIKRSKQKPSQEEPVVSSGAS